MGVSVSIFKTLAQDNTSFFSWSRSPWTDHFPKTLNIFDDHVVHFDHFVRFTCGKRKRRWNSWWCSHYAASQCIGWLWAAEQNTRLLYRRGDTHELGWLAQWPWFGFCTSSTKSSVHQRIEHKYCHCCTRPWEAQWWQLCELYCSRYRSSRTALRSLTASLELDTKAVGVFREPILGENFHPWKRRRLLLHGGIGRNQQKQPQKREPDKACVLRFQLSLLLHITTWNSSRFHGARQGTALPMAGGQDTRARD